MGTEAALVTDEERARAGVARRLVITLTAAHAIATAGVFSSSAVGSITAVALAGSERVAGWPATAWLVGATLGAYPAGRLMARAGRRLGLSAGYVAGILGALVAGLSVFAGSVAGVLAGALLLGSASAAGGLARYAAADVLPERLRGRGISAIIFAGTAGAVLGTWFIAPEAGRWVAGLGYPELAGPWLVAAVLYVPALVLLNLLLYPDPRELAARGPAAERPSGAPVASAAAGAAGAAAGRPVWQAARTPAGFAALATLALAQTAMIAVMTITPVHMVNHGHELEAVTFVLAMHFFGMFGLSLVTGWLSDRWGRAPTIAAGGLLILAACGLAPLWPATEPLAASLFLLGLGWNMCFVAGSALWTDGLAVDERARLQGAGETLVNLASITGSLASGELLAIAGYGSAALLGGAMAIVVLIVALRPGAIPRLRVT